MTISEALSRVAEIRQLVTQNPFEMKSSAASATASGSSVLAAALTEATSAATSTSSTAFAQALAAATGSAGTGSVASSAAVAAPAASSGSGVSGTDIVEAAKKYLGVPYVFGGEDASGMDCSGLVQRVLADLGISAPRVVSQQQHIGTEVGSLAEAQPGDLLVTHNADHIVIYAGDGKIIHAPYPGKDVVLRDNYLTDADIQTIRRVVPAEVDIASTVSTASSVASADLVAARLALLGGAL
jgi:cell wall-associated NlpC family hydrolase